MSTLTKKEITGHLKQGKLLINARRLNATDYDVQAASYDLSIGIAITNREKSSLFQKKKTRYEFDPTKPKQEIVKLKPGQMIYVITHEEIAMPMDLCGTVYSRNSLALDGILALNTGHIDPGYQGPITIKLINLRSVDWTFQMGKAIFTIAFHTLQNYEADKTIKYKSYTKNEILEKVLKATDVSLSNALYDLALLREFVKEDEFGRAFKKWITKSVWGIITGIFTLMLTLIGATYSVYKLLEATGLLTTIKDHLK